MSRRLPVGGGETFRTACARGLLRAAVDEKSGELVSASSLAERVGWAVDLVSGMTGELMAERWNATGVDILASGEDAGAGSFRRAPGWRCAAWAGP